ncbi:MAG TPA: lysylphosphatidylglycerol synthase transmembrane domain-containing protein [Roseiflexaceae bacterium]|nr:lysylphosphatidylglycerol synthase transmembrane domain-containing protein [Roseiflexaceae bacterium]
MRSWKFWIGVIVSVVFLAIAVNGLDLEHFWATVREANYWWLLPGVAVYFGAVWARTWRWHYMLRHIAAIPLRRLFPVVVIGYMGNNVYPARAGEVLRSYVLRRKEGVPISASLATVVLERLFDGLVMLLFVFVTLPFTPLPAGFDALVTVFSVLFLGALFVFLALAARPQRVGRIYAWFVDRLVPLRFRPGVHGLFDRFIVGLQSLRSPRELALIFLSSALIWLTETAKYWVVMHAFPGMDVPFTVLMLMTAVVNLATTLPSSPGYVGTFDVPGIAVLTAYGVPQALATGYTLVLHVALWLPITVLGALFMLFERIGWGDFGRAVEERQLEARG